MRTVVHIPIEMPTGWHAIDYRAPKKGEYYLNSVDLASICTARHNHFPTHKKLIVEKD